MLKQQYTTPIALTSPVAAGDTQIQVLSTASYCGMGLSNHSYAMISDGVAMEWVKITGCSGTSLLVERAQLGTISIAHSKIACLSGMEYHPSIVCEIVSQGGCNSTSACVPVTRGAMYFNDAVIGADWQSAATFPNAVSISIPLKPSWVTATVSGEMVALSGIAPVGQTDFEIIILANGCNGSQATLSRSVRVCQSVGVQS
jgi:hypothetical protein